MLRNHLKEKLFWYLSAFVIVVFSLIPIVWIITLSFKTGETLGDGSFIPREFTWENYQAILQNPEFTAALRNSIIVAVTTTAISVTLGTMAAYAITRLKFRGKALVVVIALAITMFPQISLVSPLFTLWRDLGLFDTYLGLIIPYLCFSLPLAIYTLSAFFRNIPWELSESAAVDGASPFMTFRKIIAPLALPPILTTSILVFISCWNDFLLAQALTSTQDARTVPVAISLFSGATTFQSPVGSISAAAVVVTIPIIILVVIFQKRIVSGLTSGAIKG